MNWLRKLILTTVAALAVGAPLMASNPPTVPSQHGHPHTHSYIVYYRHSPTHHWVSYGTYRNYTEAVNVANRLRSTYRVQTFIRTIR
jgi:hypothetical protein